MTQWFPSDQPCSRGRSSICSATRGQSCSWFKVVDTGNRRSLGHDGSGNLPCLLPLVCESQPGGLCTCPRCGCSLVTRGAALVRGAVPHGCPTWLCTMASLSPLQLQLCTLAQAARRDNPGDSCPGGLSSSFSRSKAMLIRVLYILLQLRVFPSPTQVVCLFRPVLICWVSGATPPGLCRSAFAGMWTGILQHTGITPHCSQRQLCLSEHFLQSIPLPAFKISHLLKTLRLFSFMTLYSFNVSMNQILFFVTPISRPRVTEEIYEVTLDLHQDNERKNWPFVFIF